MTTDKRSRGRPVGSGKRDGAYLARVADELLADPKLKPTTAIKRVIYKRADPSERDETLVRRLQNKWKPAGPALLEEARVRRQQREAKPVTLADTVEAVTLLLDKLRTPEVRAALLEMGERTRRMVDSFANSPTAKALAQFADSPMGKALVNYASSPAAKRVAELHNSPTLENMRRNIERIQNPAPLTLPPKR